MSYETREGLAALAINLWGVGAFVGCVWGDALSGHNLLFTLLALAIWGTAGISGWASKRRA